MSEVALEQSETDLEQGEVDLHHWNYRVVKQIVNQKEQFAIHEAHYNAEGVMVAITETPAYPTGDNLDDLIDAIKLYVVAFEKPVFDADNYAIEDKKEEPND